MIKHRYLEKICNVFNQQVFTIILMMGTIAGCAGFEHLTSIDMAYPKAEFCKDCHIDIYNEWVKSPHAKAFTSNTFRKATHNYEFTSCLGCHVPEPTFTTPPLKSRNIFREEGVTCSSCHLEESKMTGPIEPTGKLAPHPMGVAEDRYRNSEFCGRCHEGTFKEWLEVDAENKHTCQECHMPSIKRKITQSKDFISKMIVAMEKEVLQKQHTFGVYKKVPDIEPFGVTVKKEGEIIRLILKNNIPHALPTGDFGFRMVIVDIFSVKSNDKVALIKKIELIKEINTAVPPKDSAEWTFLLPENVKAIRCVISRLSKNSEIKDKLYQIEVPIL